MKYDLMGGKTAEELNDMALSLLKKQPRGPVYDFGWNLEQVAEPNDERRINR